MLLIYIILIIFCNKFLKGKSKLSFTTIKNYALRNIITLLFDKLNIYDYKN